MLWRRFFVAIMILVSGIVGCKSVALTSLIVEIQNGNFVAAIEHGQLALIEDDANADTHFYIGVAYSSLDSVALAHEHLSKAAHLDPRRLRDVRQNIESNFVRHYNRGVVALANGQLEDAVASLKFSTKADPERAAGFHDLGIAYDQLYSAEEWSGAIAFYKIADGLRTDVGVPDFDLCFNMGSVYTD